MTGLTPQAEGKGFGPDPVVKGDRTLIVGSGCGAVGRDGDVAQGDGPDPTVGGSGCRRESEELFVETESSDFSSDSTVQCPDPLIGLGLEGFWHSGSLLEVTKS